MEYKSVGAEYKTAPNVYPNLSNLLSGEEAYNKCSNPKKVLNEIKEPTDHSLLYNKKRTLEDFIRLHKTSLKSRTLFRGIFCKRGNSPNKEFPGKWWFAAKNPDSNLKEALKYTKNKIDDSEGQGYILSIEVGENVVANTLWGAFGVVEIVDKNIVKWIGENLKVKVTKVK